MGPLPLCQLLLLLALSAALNQWIDHLSVSESQGYSQVIGISHQWKCKNERKTPLNLSSFHLPTASFISMQFESTSDPFLRVRMLWSKSIDVLTLGSLFFFFLFSLHHIHFSLHLEMHREEILNVHTSHNSVNKMSSVRTSSDLARGSRIRSFQAAGRKREITETPFLTWFCPRSHQLYILLIWFSIPTVSGYERQMIAVHQDDLTYQSH